MNEENNMVQTLRMIDTESEKDGWDQPAILYAMQAHQMGSSTALMEIQTCPGWFQTMELTDNIQETLQLMISVMSTVPKSIRRNSFKTGVFYGLLLRTETWMLHLDRKEHTKAQIATAQRSSKEHTISEHPDRIESRFLCLVTINGEITALNHDRDGEVEIYEPGGKDDQKLTGNIPKLMNRLIKEIQR